MSGCLHPPNILHGATVMKMRAAECRLRGWLGCCRGYVRSRSSVGFEHVDVFSVPQKHGFNFVTGTLLPGPSFRRKMHPMRHRQHIPLFRFDTKRRRLVVLPKIPGFKTERVDSVPTAAAPLARNFTEVTECFVPLSSDIG